jgi:hypothetical protein
MEEVEDAVASDAPIVAEIARALRSADPAASIDLHTGADLMRVSTFVTLSELVEIATSAGLASAGEGVVA